MMKGLFDKLKTGLGKTRTGITDKIDDLINNYREIDEDLLEELEEIMISADMGMTTTMEVIDELREALLERKVKDPHEIKGVLKNVLMDHIHTAEEDHIDFQNPPQIILVIGVNGAGKTTTIGKMANKFKKEGKKVLLAAGDTFRAAAIDQLKVWGERANVDVIAHGEGSDPAAVIFDGIQAAKARKVDVLICDTAGRLHNKKNLMNELAKIFRIVDKEYPGAKREVLLALDATTGQNAIAQAKTFKEAAQLTGLILTKLDGTAKGGVVFAVKSEVGIPVKIVTLGEGIDDIEAFDGETFVTSLMS